jgi:capsular polysaccharide biosynthesis protein
VKRRGLWFALAAVFFVALVTGGVAAWALSAPSRFVARSQILLTPIAAGDHTFDGFSLLRDSADPGRAARTAAILIATPQVAEGVRVQLGLDQSAASLLRQVRVIANPGRNLVTVAASASSGQRAADIANAFAAQAIAIRTAHFQSELQTAIARARSRLAAIPPVQRVLPASRALQERLGTLNGLVGTSDPTLDVGSAATAPTSPERTRSLLWIPVAFGGAMLLALIVLGFALLGRRRTKSRAIEATQLTQTIDGRMDELLAEQERLRVARDELGDVEARDRKVASRERELERRVSAVTKRESSLGKRAGELDSREAELEQRERDFAQPPRQPLASVPEPEPELAPEPAPIPIPMPAPRPGPGPAPAPMPQPELPPAAVAEVVHLRAGSGFNLIELEHLVSARSGEFPDRAVEWPSYLFFLREHADVDGSLPPSFDYLVEDVFAELL